MVKKLTIFLCSILFVLWSIGEAKASFVVEGDYIFDTIANQYWVRDMLEYENLTWDGQVSAVAARTAGIIRWNESPVSLPYLDLVDL